MSKRIVIVGGGFLGAHLAKSLDGKADVTLIEARSHFVHAPAVIRAIVDPQILDRALIPYTNLLEHGTVVQARAQSIDEDGVTLEGGRQIAADYIVVATGSENAMPFKPKSDDINGFRADNARIHAMLKAAQNVCIVGAGAVGTELAGEIAHYMPDKKVTLVNSAPSLFPSMPSKLGRDLQAKLETAGVCVVSGACAENLESLTAPYAGQIQLSNGQKIDADLIFPVIGSRACSKILEMLPGVVKSTANRIKTDAWMRPCDLPNVFAAGDVADMGDAMTVVASSRQLPWLTKVLSALVDGSKLESLKPYKPWKKAPILIPLGPLVGSSFLILFTAGDFVTRSMKGKDLFLSKYNKIFRRT